MSNVLSLRSMEQGECVVAAAPFCVRDLVASVLSVCRMSLAHRASVRIVWVDEHNALPPLLLGDADRVAQVLQNLLTSESTRLPARLEGPVMTAARSAFALCCAHLHRG